MLRHYISTNCLFKKLSATNASQFFKFPLKNFRDPRGSGHYSDLRYPSGKYTSPYHPQFTLTEEERIENEKLPLEDRVLDWKKYMKHKGKLKYTAGTYLTDVEPFPRLKIMMLCDIAMTHIRKLPDKFDYKHFIFNFIKFVMKIVDENESIIDIETQIPNVNSAEDIIEMLHNEVILLQMLVDDRPWEQIELEEKDFNAKEFFFMTAAFREKGHPTTGPVESTKHRKNERPERPATAGYSEKKMEEEQKSHKF
jgi:hypothetical protein